MIQVEGLEFEAYQHRITQSWKVFHKWRDPLCAKGVTIQSRAKLWVATVQNSITWALETTRSSSRNLQRLRAAQRRQFVRMIGSKRQHINGALEPWVEFQKRTYREAIHHINEADVDVGKSLKKKKIDWIGHVSRFGIGVRENHLVKHLILWRPLSWWKLQQKAIEQGNPFVHPRPGRIRRYESQFHRNWMMLYSRDARATG